MLNEIKVSKKFISFNQVKISYRLPNTQTIWTENWSYREYLLNWLKGAVFGIRAQSN